MIYVTSDLHGYPLSGLFRLMDRARFSDTDQLIVLGDVIDRNGDGGISMLRWMMQQANVWMILGNHEAMLLSCEFLFDTVIQRSPKALDLNQMKQIRIWQSNGAAPTLASLQALFHEDPQSALALLDYLRNAPLYQLCEAGGRRYILTHAGLGGFSPRKLLSDYTMDELLWHRPDPEESYFNDAMVIFGHTPTEYYGRQYMDRMLKKPTWINIDTGAGSGRHPMLLKLGDEEAFYAV